MFQRLPAVWLAALPAFAVLTASAQPVAPDPSSTPPAAAPASSLPYRSAFDGYRPLVDEKPIPWKEANDTVYRRGGWRAYAKEAQEKPDGAADHGGHSMPMPKKAQP